jgi:hypothetical protein
MPREGLNVIERKLAFATQNHCTQRPMNAQQPGQIRRRVKKQIAIN